MMDKLQIESIMFDWRLYAERGLPSYLHFHEDGKRVDHCEIQFLNKMLEEKNFANANQEENKNQYDNQNYHHQGHHHYHHHKQQQLNKKYSKGNFIDDNLKIRTPLPSNLKCDFCGKQHCNQPNHHACQQQQKLCEEQQRLLKLKQQQFQQQIKQQLSENNSSNKMSNANSRSLTPEFMIDSFGEYNSLIRNQQYTINTGNTLFECTGAIRKAGFLSVKKWLLRKRQHVELARKRGWKCYWACLKGTTLLFYQCNFIDNLEIDKTNSISLANSDSKIISHLNNKDYLSYDQMRPLSSKSNDTLLNENEENLYENLTVCMKCIHCSKCNVLIGNENNSIYHKNLESDSLRQHLGSLVICGQCNAIANNLPVPLNEQLNKINCCCECHKFNSLQKNQFKKSNSKNFIQQIAYQPKHLILIDNSIVQPIPEHPKREHVFCLSTAIGDAYLFQSPCENELSNWINAIQSACGASISRNKGKQGTLLKLQNEIITVQQKIDKSNRKKQQLESQIENILEQQQRQRINLSQTIRQQQQLLEKEYQQQQQHLAQLLQMGQINDKQMQQQLVNLSTKKSKLLEMAENGQFNDATLDDLMNQTNESSKNLIKQLNHQINTYDKQMEQYFCEQFRLRCYVASIQYNVKSNNKDNSNAELPNPKTLLSHVTKSTKLILNKLGIFNVSSFHAYTCARSPQILTSVLWNHSQQMQTPNQLNQIKATSLSPGINIGKHQIAQQLHKCAGQNQNLFKSATSFATNQSKSNNVMKIQLILPPPENTVHQVTVDSQQTIEQLIQSVLKQHHEHQLELIERKQQQLDILKQKHQQQPTNEYFACCKYLNNEEYFVPSNKVILSSLPPLQHMQIVPKMLFTVEFTRENTDTLFGFSVEAQCVNEQLLDETLLRPKTPLLDSNKQQPQQQIVSNLNNSKLVVHICKVEKYSLAEQEGLCKGDELVLINGILVSELDMMYVESVLQEELHLCLLLRAVRFRDQASSNTSSTSRKTSAASSSYKYSQQFNNIKHRATASSQQQNLKKKSVKESNEKLQSNKNYLLGEQTFDHQFSDDYIDSLVCPPPPSEYDLSEELLDKLIIPKPESVSFEVENQINLNKNKHFTNHLNCDEDLAGSLMKTVQQVKDELNLNEDKNENLEFFNLKTETNKDEQFYNKLETTLNENENLNLVSSDQKSIEVKIKPNLPISKSLEIVQQSTNKKNWLANRNGKYLKKYSLTEAEKVNKVINELLETEITYVKHLDDLIEIYILPIKKQSILSSLDILSLFGNMQEVIEFQKNFLYLLKQCILKYMPESHFSTTDLTVYKDVLIALSKLFLYFTQEFRQYSIFCSSHFKCQKLLFANSKESNQCANYDLIEFVKKKSKGEKAFSLESYLIKPIQRILKYPLLIQQLKELASQNDEECEYLNSSLKGMERVAEHINEMQRINEEYGHIIDNLQKNHYKNSKQLVSLGPCELLYYDEVYWSNVNDFLGKIKKSLDLYSMCFVYKSAVIFFCIERNRNKKKNIHRNDCLETVRYQILMPINEIQVRSIGNKADLLSAKPSSTNETIDEQADVHPQFYWELIHLKCSLLNNNTQKRSEKVFQLYNNSKTFRNVFLRNIRRLIRDSVRKMGFTNKTSLSQESVNSIEISSKEELLGDGKISLNEICELNLDDLKMKQLKLSYFNATTLMQHLNETNGYEDEDKSCSSEKI